MIEKYFGELLENLVNVDVDKICLNILCVDGLTYNLAFIQEETDNMLIVWVTGADMRERPHIIMKDKIISVSVVYDDDIELVEIKDNDVMVG